MSPPKTYMSHRLVVAGTWSAAQSSELAWTIRRDLSLSLSVSLVLSLRVVGSRGCVLLVVGAAAGRWVLEVRAC